MTRLRKRIIPAAPRSSKIRARFRFALSATRRARIITVKQNISEYRRNKYVRREKYRFVNRSKLDGAHERHNSSVERARVSSGLANHVGFASSSSWSSTLHRPGAIVVRVAKKMENKSRSRLYTHASGKRPSPSHTFTVQFPGWCMTHCRPNEMNVIIRYNTQRYTSGLTLRK